MYSSGRPLTEGEWVCGDSAVNLMHNKLKQQAVHKCAHRGFASFLIFLSAYLSHISDDGLLYNSHINKYILLLGKDNLSK